MKMAENNEDKGKPLPTPEELAAQAAAAEAKALAEKEKAEAEAAEARKVASGVNKEDQDMIERLVSERLEVKLADIKKSLDGAYKQRDASLARIAEFEARERDATLKRLTEEGKHKEAFDIQLGEEKAKNAALLKRNIELSRDVVVRDAIRGLPFRTDKSSSMAFIEITSNLTQTEAGEWKHRSGITVKDYCEAFAKDPENEFLFKPKANSGGGSSNNTGATPPADSGKSKSLFGLSQAEVLKLAAEGKLKGQRPPI